jgi:hypothetical protein
MKLELTAKKRKFRSMVVSVNKLDEILQLNSDEPCPRWSGQENIRYQSFLECRPRLNDPLSNNNFEVLIFETLTVCIDAGTSNQ